MPLCQRMLFHSLFLSLFPITNTYKHTRAHSIILILAVSTVSLFAPLFLSLIGLCSILLLIVQYPIRFRSKAKLKPQSYVHMHMHIWYVLYILICAHSCVRVCRCMNKICMQINNGDLHYKRQLLPTLPPHIFTSFACIHYFTTKTVSKLYLHCFVCFPVSCILHFQYSRTHINARTI